ncbi:MAG: YtxH domain-containing protein [Vicinamibacterales bacterium]
MARDDSAGAGSILLAFLLGAVSGAAVALLYAPAAGDETRELLGQRAKEGRERAAAAAEKGRDVLNQSRDMLSQGRDILSQGRETLSHAIDRGREAYQQARSQESA